MAESFDSVEARWVEARVEALSRIVAEHGGWGALGPHLDVTDEPLRSYLDAARTEANRLVPEYPFGSRLS